jgi:hypothetical protein
LVNAIGTLLDAAGCGLGTVSLQQPVGLSGVGEQAGHAALEGKLLPAMACDEEDPPRASRWAGVDEAGPPQAPEGDCGRPVGGQPRCQSAPSQLACHAADVSRFDGEQLQHHRAQRHAHDRDGTRTSWAPQP